ncbi:MAG: hypothetical protein ACTSSP_08740 [Candidatus Asgardarchaeia archaeon]
MKKTKTYMDKLIKDKKFRKKINKEYQDLCKETINLIGYAEQITLLKIKSLLNHLSYLIKNEHKSIVEDFHRICRKYCKLRKE